MNMWQYLKQAIHPVVQRLGQLKYLTLLCSVLTAVLGIAWVLDQYQIYLGFLVTTIVPVMGYVAVLDVILAILLYILISRHLQLTMKLLVYAIIVYGLFTLSGTGLPWTSALINLVTVVLSPWLLERYRRYQWVVASVTTLILLVTFIFANAPGQSVVMGMIYFVPAFVLWSLVFQLPSRTVHDILTAVTISYPAMFVGIIVILINPNGNAHYQAVEVNDHSYLITQETTTFIDQVYILKVYEDIGLGFYHEIYVYSKEWEVSLWTMQDATLIYEDSTYTITLTSPDLSEHYSDQFTTAD